MTMPGEELSDKERNRIIFLRVGNIFFHICDRNESKKKFRINTKN